jgi:sigma-B regulation protein RsbU (phosphoserine phosphatase)
MPDEVFVERTVDLEPGDRLCLFTDGATDCRDDRGETLGHHRLQEAFQASATKSASAITNSVVEEIKRFCGATKPTDDMTLVVAEIK